VAAIYVGQDQHAIDVKGRINIPARHRRVAAQRGCVQFWFSPGFGPYVMLWDAQGFEAYSERLLQLPAGDRKVMHLRRSIYSNACEVEPDGQGRVVIPEWLRKQADLQGQAAVLGVHDHMELWNPETYRAHVESQRETLADLASELPF
jgi:MraZ protein